MFWLSLHGSWQLSQRCAERQLPLLALKRHAEPCCPVSPAEELPGIAGACLLRGFDPMHVAGHDTEPIV